MGGAEARARSTDCTRNTCWMQGARYTNSPSQRGVGRRMSDREGGRIVTRGPFAGPPSLEPDCGVAVAASRGPLPCARPHRLGSGTPQDWPLRSPVPPTNRGHPCCRQTVRGSAGQATHTCASRPVLAPMPQQGSGETCRTGHYPNLCFRGTAGSKDPASRVPVIVSPFAFIFSDQYRVRHCEGLPDSVVACVVRVSVHQSSAPPPTSEYSTNVLVCQVVSICGERVCAGRLRGRGAGWS